MIKSRGTCSWSAQMRTNYGENLSDYPQNGGDICNWKGVGAVEAGGKLLSDMKWGIASEGQRGGGGGQMGLWGSWNGGGCEVVSGREGPAASGHFTRI